MKDEETLVLGAVAYDPRVVTIWDGFRAHFAQHGLSFDYVLFSNYERQVRAFFDGLIGVAWNSPLAWLQSEAVAAVIGRKVIPLCMRNTDRDLASVIVIRAGEALNSPADLRGRRVAVGAADSPQATLIPLNFLAEHGIRAGHDFELARFDLMAGKHGDHIGGEREAIRALMAHKTDAACVLEANRVMFENDGTIAPGDVRVLGRTPPFDHCNFTAAAEDAQRPIVKRFCELLLAMSYADEKLRPLLDMEGLRHWMPGRASGYAQLRSAVERFGTIDHFVHDLKASVGPTGG